MVIVLSELVHQNVTAYVDEVAPVGCGRLLSLLFSVLPFVLAATGRVAPHDRLGDAHWRPVNRPAAKYEPL